MRRAMPKAATSRNRETSEPSRLLRGSHGRIVIIGSGGGGSEHRGEHMFERYDWVHPFDATKAVG
jgi:hypothetical protein